MQGWALSFFLWTEGGEGDGGSCRVKLPEALKCGVVFSEPLCTEGATDLAQPVALSLSFHYSQLCTLV